MQFLSLQFLIFTLCSVLCYHQLPDRFRNSFLFIISIFFYLTWSLKYTVLLLVSIVCFYFLAIKMEDSSDDAKKWSMLRLGILIQLLVLFSFKFLSSFPGPLSKLFNFSPAANGIPAVCVLMPLGLSYYTFKLLSYGIDVFFKRIKAERDFMTLASHVSFFPQIVGGPIQRALDFLPQTKQEFGIQPEMIASGLRLILCGLFKKMVVADTLNIHIDHFINRSPDYLGIPGLLFTYLIPIQIYADFSGLTDIAIGVGRLFGFQCRTNFALPFYARNIQEFWRRWHITLTSWLSDYLFIPLQIKLRSRPMWGLIFGLFITMMAVALWHGITLTWILFGLIQAFYIVGSALTLKTRDSFFDKIPGLRRIRRFTAPLILFHMVLFSFLFFKAVSLKNVGFILSNAMYSIQNMTALFKRLGSDWQTFIHVFVGMGFGLNKRTLIKIFSEILVMESIHACQNVERLKSLFFSCPAWIRWASYQMIAVSIILFGNYDNSRFIYALF